MKYREVIESVLNGPRGPNVAAFFDLDGTLVQGFTASAIFADRIRKRQVPAGDLARLVAGIVDGTFGGDQRKVADIGLASLRGHMEDQLVELGERLFVQRIAGTIRPQARSIVKAHQRMGHTVVLASAATHFQVDPVARDLGVPNVLCSELESEDGVLTGRVRGKLLWGEPKAQAVRRFAREHDVDLTASYGYANGDEDVPFLASVGRPHAISPHRGLREAARLQNWPVLNLEEPLRSGARGFAGTLGAIAGLNTGLGIGVGVGLLRGDRRFGINTGIPLACDLALAAAGIQVRVTGDHNLWQHRPAIFVANHQSNLDPIVVGSLLRRDFTAVAKAEARNDPRSILGNLLFEPAYVDRSNPEQARAELDKLVDRIHAGTSVMIFPEGTRMPTPEPGRFKKGGFHLAMQAGVPMVPIVLRGAGDLMRPHAKVIHPGVVDAKVLDPIPTDDWKAEDLDQITQDVRQLFVDTLETWPA